MLMMMVIRRATNIFFTTYYVLGITISASFSLLYNFNMQNSLKTKYYFVTHLAKLVLTYSSFLGKLNLRNTRLFIVCLYLC